MIWCTLKTTAIFVGIGPLVGMALTLSLLFPGSQSTPRELFDMAILAYMFGGPFAILTGAAAVYLKRFGPLIFLLAVPLLAGLLALLGGWFSVVCSTAAALVCALLDLWLNPMAGPLPPARE